MSTMIAVSTIDKFVSWQTNNKFISFSFRRGIVQQQAVQIMPI